MARAITLFPGPHTISFRPSPLLLALYLVELPRFWRARPMPAASLSHVLRHLRTLSELQATRDLSDGELLERFRVHREETAFALLVQRHGPMVLGVCRRLLGDAHAAEDAFQATFLILVRKAASIRKQGSVASWLYGVSRRVAIKANSPMVAFLQGNVQMLMDRDAFDYTYGDADGPDPAQRDLDELLPRVTRVCVLEGAIFQGRAL